MSRQGSLREVADLHPLVMKAEGAANHMADMLARSEDYTFQVGPRLHAGYFIPATDYIQALKLRAGYLADVLARASSPTSTSSSRQRCRSRCPPSHCPRDNGFSASRLGLLLRTNGINHFAIAGGEAFGMIDAIAREALDCDLGVSVAEDAVGFAPEDISTRTTWRRLLADAGAKLIEAEAVFASGGSRSA